MDAIAIAVLSSGNEVANGNAAQIVGYKLGAFFGSGILFWIYSAFEWSGLFYALFAVYASVLVVFLCTLSHRLVESNPNQWQSLTLTWSQMKLSSPTNVVQSMGSISSSTRNLLCYLVLYKLGESAASTTFPFFLTRNGVSSGQIAFWNGTVAMLCSIVGSTIASKLKLSQ